MEQIEIIYANMKVLNYIISNLNNKTTPSTLEDIDIFFNLLENNIKALEDDYTKKLNKLKNEKHGNNK